MDVADRLLLLAIAADNSGWPLDAAGQPRVPSAFRYGTAAALLAELALRRRVGAGRRIVVLDPAATGDAELDAALAAVPPGGRRTRRCVGDIAARRPDLVRLHAMRVHGLLHTYPHRGGQYLFVRETTTALEQVVTPLHAAMSDLRCDEPTRALLAVMRATKLHRFWLQGMPAAERDRRLRDLLADDWIPPLSSRPSTWRR